MGEDSCGCFVLHPDASCARIHMDGGVSLALLRALSTDGHPLDRRMLAYDPGFCELYRAVGSDSALRGCRVPDELLARRDRPGDGVSLAVCSSARQSRRPSRPHRWTTPADRIAGAGAVGSGHLEPE